MLFLPAHKLDWVKKVARFRPASVVLDLEDAVPADLKQHARSVTREAISMLSAENISAFVRINAFGCGGQDDVREIVCRGLAGIILPKAGSAEEIRELDRLIGYAEGLAQLELNSVAILPLPETAEGLLNAAQLASASKRVKGLVGVIGGPVGGDVALAVGYRPSLEGTEQLYLNSKIVLDSRAGNAPYPMASIIGTKLDDHDSVRRLITRARNLGYAGVLLIHPSHVAIANEVYTPTREEVRHSAGLLEALREGTEEGSAAVRYEGVMIDYAMVPVAEAVLRDAERRGISAESNKYVK